MVCLRDACSAQAELGIGKLPDEVEAFGQFMLRQSQKDLTPLDVVKAYTITQSSIRRGAVTVGRLNKSWPNNPWSEEPSSTKVRPEDIFAALLLTPTGSRYLRAAARGEFDEKAARSIVGKLAGGLEASLYKKLYFAAQLAGITPEIEQTLRDGSKADWFNLTAKAVSGIDAAKAGFWAAFLGRGDLPTFDARELNYWVTSITPREGKRTRTYNGQRQWLVWSDDKKKWTWTGASSLVKPTYDLVERLGERFRSMEVSVDPELQPFYEHLVHHAVWDKVGGVYDNHKHIFQGGGRTTHAEVCQAFEVEEPVIYLDGLRGAQRRRSSGIGSFKDLKKKPMKKPYKGKKSAGVYETCFAFSPVVDYALAFAGEGKG